MGLGRTIFRLNCTMICDNMICYLGVLIDGNVLSGRFGKVDLWVGGRVVKCNGLYPSSKGYDGSNPSLPIFPWGRSSAG